MSTRIIVHKNTDCEFTECDFYKYGIVGDVTDMTYENGEVMQVGDVVKIFNDGKNTEDDNFVVKDNTAYFIMGLKGFNFKLGKHKNWSVELIKKFYEVEDNEEFSVLKMVTRDTNKDIEKIITIDDEDIKISNDVLQVLKKIVKQLDK